MNKTLEDLIEKARHIKITPSMKWDQTVSFIYGNMGMKNPSYTREMAEAAVTKLVGPRPKD